MLSVPRVSRTSWASRGGSLTCRLFCLQVTVWRRVGPRAAASPTRSMLARRYPYLSCGDWRVPCPPLRSQAFTVARTPRSASSSTQCTTRTLTALTRIVADGARASCYGCSLRPCRTVLHRLALYDHAPSLLGKLWTHLCCARMKRTILTMARHWNGRRLRVRRLTVLRRWDGIGMTALLSVTLRSGLCRYCDAFLALCIMGIRGVMTITSLPMRGEQ